MPPMINDPSEIITEADQHTHEAGARIRRTLATVSILVLVAACGPSISDAQKVWCDDHDMTPAIPGVIDGIDSAVLRAAHKLDIAVPPELEAADCAFGMAQLTGDMEWTSDIPGGWPDVMSEWVKTSDYARACIAAYEAR